MRFRYEFFAWLCVALAAGVMAPLGARGGRADVVMLKRVASSVTERAGVIAIEASDPVPYVASQPDPQTFVVELREVVAVGFADSVRVDAGHPMADVHVESGVAADGVNVARVRMTLTRPMRPRVRSSKNVIYVEADRAGSAELASAPVGDTSPARLALAPPPPAPPSDVTIAPARAVQAERIAASRAVLQAAQAPQPAQPQAPVGTTQTTPQRYTGDPVSLDFQGADLRAVLRTFSEISGLNLVIDPTIQGTVDVSLRDVPWDQALDVILRANKLGYVVDGTIVRVAPLGVLADEEAQRRKLSDEQALAGELRVLTHALSYAKAEDLRPLLTATVLSQRGSLQTDARTNTVIINDLPERLARATDLLKTLDRPEPQVEIEARIIQTNRAFAQQIGVQWGVNGRATPALGNTLPLAFPNSVDAAATGGRSVTSPTSALSLALGSINGAINLDVALSALEAEGRGRILSTPRVSTQNNIEAEITQGIQIPIQTVANNTVTVTFKDAALTLRVTPQITASDTVIMRINVENASPDFSRSVNNIPPIDTQRAVTQVLMNNGETTVIGGIYINREQSVEERTPILHRLPLLGWLFKYNDVQDESRELLIFITPRITRL